MKVKMNRSFLPAFGYLFACMAFLQGSPAWTDESGSRWIKAPHAAIRLINAVWDGKGPARIGVEIILDKGWKTYWRQPGDAGVPPQFDWSGSENRRSSRIFWPAPQRFGDEYGTSIGYKHRVVFPVEVMPKEPGKPIHVALKLDYAVCADVCIPAEAVLSLVIRAGGEAGKITRMLQEWAARAPSASPTEGFAISRPEAFEKDGKAMIRATIRRAGGLENPDLFAEGPGNIYISVPEKIREDGDSAVFQFMADGVTSLEELRKLELRLTARDDRGAVERRVRVR